MTTSNPRPSVGFGGSRRRNLGDVGIERNPRTELESLVASSCLRLDDRDGCVVRGGRHDAQQPDRPATDDRHGIGRVDPVGTDGGVVRDRERLDHRALCERETLWQLVKPLTARLEVFGVGAVDRKAEMISPARPDDALAYDCITRREPADGRAGLDDLAAPFVAGDDRIRDRNDVAALVELEVRVTDTDGVGADEDVVGADLGMIDVGDDGLLGSFKDQGFHRSPSSRTGCSG